MAEVRRLLGLVPPGSVWAVVTFELGCAEEAVGLFSGDSPAALGEALEEQCTTDCVVGYLEASGRALEPEDLLWCLERRSSD